MAELLQRLEVIRGAIHARTWLRVLLIWFDLLLMSFLAFEVSLQFLLGHLGIPAMLGVAVLSGGLIWTCEPSGILWWAGYLLLAVCWRRAGGVLAVC